MSMHFKCDKCRKEIHQKIKENGIYRNYKGIVLHVQVIDADLCMECYCEILVNGDSTVAKPSPSPSLKQPSDLSQITGWGF